MAHIVYDKLTKQPLMVVVNATPVHIASLEKQFGDDPDKGLRIIAPEIYEKFSSHEDILSSIVGALNVEISNG